jgi:hypothetical protein
MSSVKYIGLDVHKESISICVRNISFNRTFPVTALIVHLGVDCATLAAIISKQRKVSGPSLDAHIGTPLKNLSPSEAFDDSVGRSVAAGAGGFLVFGGLQAAGAFPTIYRESLFVASGMLAAFLMTLTLSLAYYRRRWRLGVGGATLSLILPFFVNILWAKYLGHSLVYPTAALVLLGALVFWAGHRKISGPHWEGDIENELIENLAEGMAFSHVALLCPWRNSAADSLASLSFTPDGSWACRTSGSPNTVLVRASCLLALPIQH